MLILPDASASSRKLLDQEIADRFRITLLVIGDGTGFDVIASKADVRAQALASARRVVWVRDAALLSASELGAFTNGGNAVVTVLNLDGSPVVFLDFAEANDFVEIESAFITAQAS